MNFHKVYHTKYHFNKVIASPTLSAGISYKINSRMNLRIEPEFRFSAIPLENAPIHEYLYSGGLNISYLFGL
ncbi:MAG: hypothetical protein U0T73_06635 [Chitinophagales bacterium]